MSKIKKFLILIIFLTIVLLCYFVLIPKPFLGGDMATWNTGTESVLEYLELREDLDVLTQYLGCKCADYPFCYSCRYDSNNSTYIYYYDGKFIISPYEYVISGDNIEKQDLSIKEKGWHFLFNAREINMFLIQDLIQNGRFDKIISDDRVEYLEIDEISKFFMGQDDQYQLQNVVMGFEFKVVDDDSKYKVIKKIDKRDEECGTIDILLETIKDVDIRNEMIREMNRCKTKDGIIYKHEVYVYQEGMDFSYYRIDYMMDKIYFTGRKKVLENLNALQKFENQLFDIYLKTHTVVKGENESFILKKDNPIEDVYKIIEEDKDKEKTGVFVYKNNFLVGMFGGEYYGIEIYSFEGNHKGQYCQNTWAIGGGHDSNPRCKIPASAVSVYEYIETLKNKYN